MLDAVRWLNVHKRLELNTLKVKIGEAPEYLTEQLKEKHNKQF